MNKITVKNVSSSNVAIVAHDAKYRRELVPGREVAISQEIYEELMFEPGVLNLIKAGFIRFSGEAAAEAIEVAESTNTQVAEKKDIEEILKARDITKFTRLISKASVATRESIVKLAVDFGVTEKPFVALIKKYCDVDVIEAIAKKHQAED